MRLKWLWILFLCLSGSTGFKNTIEAAPIRIAYSSISGAMLPLWVTQERGFFKRQGLDVELTYIRGVSLEAMIAGEVQFIRASPPGVIRATLKGLDVTIVANTINTPVFSIMSRPEIKRPQDIRGKTIGVTNFGDSPDLVLSMVLERWGLQRGKDVAVLAVHAGMPELLAAVSTGRLDAGVISAPSNLRGVKLGLRELLDVSELGIPYINSPLTTTRSYLKTHHATAIRVLRAYCEGIRHTREDREPAMGVLTKYTRIKDAEILNEVYRIYGLKHLEEVPYVHRAAVQGILGAMGEGTDKVNLDSFVDNTLMRELEQEGLFKRVRKAPG